MKKYNCSQEMLEDFDFLHDSKETMTDGCVLNTKYNM